MGFRFFDRTIGIYFFVPLIPPGPRIVKRPHLPTGFRVGGIKVRTRTTTTTAAIARSVYNSRFAPLTCNVFTRGDFRNSQCIIRGRLRGAVLDVDHAFQLRQLFVHVVCEHLPGITAIGIVFVRVGVGSVRERGKGGTRPVLVVIVVI